VPTLGKAVEASGWTMWTVQVQRVVCQSVTTTAGAKRIAAIERMQGSPVTKKPQHIKRMGTFNW